MLTNASIRFPVLILAATRTPFHLSRHSFIEVEQHGSIDAVSIRGSPFIAW